MPNKTESAYLSGGKENNTVLSHFLMYKMIPLFCCLAFCLRGQKPKTAHVAPYQGRPTIFIGEQPVSPQFYALTHVYGGRWSWEERPSRNLRNFCEAGIRLFQVDLYLEDIWYQNTSKLDLSKAQRQIKGVLDVCPDAAVVVRIHVNAPFWWNEANRSECTEYADGAIDQKNMARRLTWKMAT